MATTDHKEDNLLESSTLTSKSKKYRNDSSYYLGKRRYGGGGVDSSDEDDPDLVNKTPNTKRKIVDDKFKSSVAKLGTFATYLTLMKGFICTSILYLPKGNTINGGYGFSNICMLSSMTLTIFCALKVLQVTEKCNAGSYTQLGL